MDATQADTKGGNVAAAVLMIVGGLALGLVAIGALVLWSIIGVVRDDLDPDNSPTIQRFEAEHPALSDLELRTGSRTSYSRKGGEPGLISLGYSTGSFHVQGFEPLAEWALSDVASEIIELGEAEGYEFVQDGQRWCSRYTTDGQMLRYAAAVEIVSSDPIARPEVDFVPHVSVRLAAAGC